MAFRDLPEGDLCQKERVVGVGMPDFRKCVIVA